MACLLLRYAPDADLYVAKVTSSLEFDMAAGVIKAIEWAVSKDVQADIITMSFGVEQLNMRLDEALSHVMNQLGNAGHTPLVFASASNSGLAKPSRSYPASDSRVICAYALDGVGNNSSGLNPPLSENAFNFGTLGHGVEVKWGGVKGYASGTS
ncbi:hypothetical protein HJFPF1_10662 [Paramyrothecium foliicola]|nr:hypothetical protein HJFPF1_10662 [Paramyrothecium foliicola]